MNIDIIKHCLLDLAKRAEGLADHLSTTGTLLTNDRPASIPNDTGKPQTPGGEP